MSSSASDSAGPCANSPFLSSLGVEVVERLDGRAVLRLKVDERHLRTRGIAHGGLLSTLLDTAMGIAVSTGTPDGSFAVTAQLNVNFVRPAWDGEVLETTGLVCHRGQQTAVAQGETRTAKGVLVALSSGTFSYVRNTSPDSEPLERRPDLPVA
jgi:acyl-CoA thioesterase